MGLSFFVPARESEVDLVPVKVKLTAVLLTAAALFAQALPARAVGLTDAAVAPFEQRLDARYPLTDLQVSQLEAMIKKHPDEAYLHFLLARHQRRLGYPQLADETIAEARTRPDASGFFKRSIEQSVSDADVARALLVMQFAQDWHNKSDIAQALSAFAFNEKALTARSPDDRLLLEGQAEKIITDLKNHRQTWPAGVGGLLGQTRYLQGKFKEAIDLADADLKKDPRSLLANEVKGLAYVALSNLPAAVTPLAVVFEKSPNNGRTTPAYAQALIAAGQDAKALEPALFSLTQACDETQLRIYEQRLADLIAHTKPDVLEATIREVARKAQWTTEVYTYFFALGETFEVANRPKQALWAYATASSLNKAPTTALNRIARLHQNAGRYDEAKMCFLLSLAANRENASSAIAFNRLQDRLSNRKNDVAWRFKDWLRRAF